MRQCENQPKNALHFFVISNIIEKNYGLELPNALILCYVFGYVLYVCIVDPSQDFLQEVRQGPWHSICEHDQVEVGL